MLSPARRCFLLQRIGLHNSLTVTVTSFWVYRAILFPFFLIWLTHQRHVLQLLLSFRFDCTRSGDNCDFSSTVLHQKHDLVYISDWILHRDSGSDYNYCLVLRRYCLGSTGLLFEPILTGFSGRFYSADARLRQVTTAAPLCGRHCSVEPRRTATTCNLVCRVV